MNSKVFCDKLGKVIKVILNAPAQLGLDTCPNCGRADCLFEFSDSFNNQWFRCMNCNYENKLEQTEKALVKEV